MMTNSRLSEVAKTILAPPVKFVGVTSYNQQYQPYKMVRNQQNNQNPQQNNDILSPYKSQLHQKPTVKFQGISLYKSTYLTPPETKRKIQPQSYKKPQAPFYGTSSYKDQYKPIGVITPSLKQAYDSLFKSENNNRVRFQGKSAYKEQYLPYQVSLGNSNNSMFENSKICCRLDEINIPNLKFTKQKI